ncbi:hypothetical protein ACQI4F_20040 [Mycolicibacterium vaccae]|uniref:hypothetical protein n=1 Tax=Mycolicibacterium vaccae TaxID=1810 RepID=UPI003CEAE520
MTRAVLLDEELLGLVKSVVSVGETIETLGLARPNRIAAVGRDGVWVETERSNEKDGQAQLVPAWMISAAWDVLKLKGSVSQQALVKNLRITRSAFVCALIARFPGVVTETSPRIALRLNAASSNTNPPSREHGVVNAAPKQSRAGHGVGVGIAATRPKREPLIQPSNSSAATYSASPGGISGNADADSKPTTYAERLNHLFETIHPPERGPFTASEVAEALQAEGIPVHEASLTALRTDAESSPSRLLTEALAYFFNVDAEYLAEAAWKDAARSVGGVEPDADEYQPAGRPGRRRRIHDESPPRECEPSLSEPSVAGIMFSNGDLLRIIGGLSSAARYTGDRVYADRALLRRLTSQISEAAHFLQESVSGGVAVPVRFLEHVIVAWDESSPPDSGTAEDYRWLAELMNRHLSY